MNCPQEDELMKGLRALAAASKDEEAPPRVEERLRCAFRQQALAAKSQRRTAHRRRWPWVAAVAAGSMAAAGFLWFHPAAVPSRPAPRVAVAQAAAPKIAPVAPVSGTPRPIGRPRRRVKRQPAPAPPAEVMTDFLPVAQGDDWTPLDGARLMRVEVPRSALGAFGLPVNEEREPERVRADVILSDDGLLRAIRFVE